MGALSPSNPARNHLDPNSRITVSSSCRNDDPGEEVGVYGDNTCRCCCGVCGDPGNDCLLWRRPGRIVETEVAEGLRSTAEADDAVAMPNRLFPHSLQRSLFLVIVAILPLRLLISQKSLNFAVLCDRLILFHDLGIQSSWTAEVCLQDLGDENTMALIT